MTSELFIQSVGTFVLLGSAMLQKLRRLSPDLSADERAVAYEKLQPLHENLVKNREANAAIQQERLALVETARHEFAPQIHQAIEESERASAIDSLTLAMEP